MANNHNAIENRLWDSADELRANSKLKASEYSVPVLGLIFLRYADHKFGQAERDLARTARRQPAKADYQARGVLYLPEPARFSRLLNLPEGEDVGKAVNTLPCTLWFLDRGKRQTARKDKVLFIDARHIYRQIDRAHRDFTPEQI